MSLLSLTETVYSLDFTTLTFRKVSMSLAK